MIESGNKSLGKISEMSRTINRYLKLDDGYTVSTEGPKTALGREEG